MADRVDNIMEHMLEEFNFYQIEELFSKGEIKNIVKNRRSHEYQMHRKDAEIPFFIDAIHYEKQLQKTKAIRKQKFKGQKKKFDFQDQAIKRRVIHLYDRATRKFKQNIPLWKEYLQYLCVSNSTQKLNKVISSVVQTHPTVVDFWLIGAYVELDLKGNLFQSRKLMLQGIRNNDNNAMFYVEYFRFEVALLEKIIDRRDVLMKNTGNEAIGGNLDFVDEEKEGSIPEKIHAVAGTFDTSTSILQIIFGTIQDKFGTNFRVFEEIWKGIVKSKSNQIIDQTFRSKIQQVFKTKKIELVDQFAELRLNKSPGFIDKLVKKYLPHLLSKQDPENLDKTKLKLIKFCKKSSQIQKIITHFATTYDDKLNLILQNFTLLSQEPDQLLQQMDSILKQFEVQDDLIFLVLKTKLSFKNQELSKEFLIELEELTNNYNQKLQHQGVDGNQISKILAASRGIIIDQMVLKNQVAIAESYIKKAILSNAGDSVYVNAILNLVSDHVCSTSLSLDFLIQLIKLSSLKQLDKEMFETLLVNQELIENVVKKRLQKNKIFECMLNQYQFQNDADVWLKYISFLNHYDHKKARTQYERALIMVKDVSHKQEIVRQFTKYKN